MLVTNYRIVMSYCKEEAQPKESSAFIIGQKSMICPNKLCNWSSSTNHPFIHSVSNFRNLISKTGKKLCIHSLRQCPKEVRKQIFFEGEKFTMVSPSLMVCVSVKPLQQLIYNQLGFKKKRDCSYPCGLSCSAFIIWLRRAFNYKVYQTLHGKNLSI